MSLFALEIADKPYRAILNLGIRVPNIGSDSDSIQYTHSSHLHFLRSKLNSQCQAMWKCRQVAP